MQTDFRNRAAEGALAVVFLAWLIWLPLPFGSVIETAQTPLIVVPLALCAIAAIVRQELSPVTAWRIWTAGAIGLLVVVALQLVPLPLSLLRIVSPRAAEIWMGSDRVYGINANAHPISINPGATYHEWFRLLALFATFQTSALLIRSHWRRIALTIALIAAASFEFLYGVNEAATRRYAIWGWKNKLIFNRVTGTFVNPNHFAHYLAIIIPVAAFLAAWAWHHAAPDGAPVARRIARLIEKNMLPFGIGVLGATGCLAGILVGQSRGALLALFCATALVGTIAMARMHAFRASRRRRALFVTTGALSSLLLLGLLIAWLGTARTIQRFEPNETETVTLVGRTVGWKVAFGVWRLFPIFGSGAGTFVNASGMAQTDSFAILFDHAHDDYLELAATTGILGFGIGAIALFGGCWSLVRITFGARAEGSYRRRAFQAAALTSIAIAMVHAVFDFNFFIPANPATLAAIAGAAVSSYGHSFDADATADRVTRHRVRKANADAMDSA
jgi:O-antigen ligase